jgi:hypothetical protein
VPKVVVLHKSDGAARAAGSPEDATEVFEGVARVWREEGWLVIVKEGGGGEFGINRDEVASYWLAADDVFDAAAAAELAKEQAREGA